MKCPRAEGLPKEQRHMSAPGVQLPTFRANEINLGLYNITLSLPHLAVGVDR